MYDVIVIGAGPAGSTAAKVLSEKGYRVLLVEKFKLPRYKSCSGILIKKSMDLVELYFGESIPKSVMCTPADNRGMIFTDDKGREFRFEQEGVNVWRSSFDSWVSTKAKENGTEIRDETSAVFCEEKDDYVSVILHGKDTYIENARYVLDCEGVVGTIKRKIIKDTPEYITTFQTFNKGSIDLDTHYFYAYLQPELSEYDAWFNVKDNFLIFGVAVKDRSKIQYYYDKFLAYMKNRHHLQIDEQTRTEKWLMPHIRPDYHIDYGVNRILFAGEIAGFLNPMGEGISAGIESGYYAACAIADHFEDIESVCNNYQQSTKKLKTYMERQWKLVGGMADTFKEMKSEKLRN
ncbi:MAG: NAD(P)/FAD-dependent oxidoreductase [Clostridium sp.]|nr:NAD(P)/FAD-dependent oxidoreductase [Clostridium sp.]